jgi:phage shock protein A
MRLPIPDPRDALALAAGGPALVAQLVGAFPRVLDLLDDAEALVKRAHQLVDDIDRTRQDADEVVRQTRETVKTADESISSTGKTLDDANALVVRAAGTIGSVEPTLERTERLVDGFAPSLEKLQPMLERLASTTDVTEVDAIIEMIDQAPVLMKRLETDVLPMMAGLGTVAPDIHDMLDLIEELNEMLAKVPGLGRVKKRIDEEQAEEAETRVVEAAEAHQEPSGRAG